MTTEIQTALANEARRLELKTKLAAVNATLTVVSAINQRLQDITNVANSDKTTLSSQLTTLEAGAGPGVTADFGTKSVVTQLIELERFTAKAACIDFVKANPTCTEQEAADTWNAAALTTHTSLPLVLQDGLAMGRLYRANLLQGMYISTDTWDAQRAWIIATPKEVIMGA